MDAAVTRIAAALGARTFAGTATAANPSDVPERAEEAGEIARPGPAHDWLLGLLTPLLDHQHLLATLRAYVDHDYSRQATAEALVVHRNTLNYRLNRIAVLTGHDPGRLDHIPLFAAALTAYDLDAATDRPRANT